MFPVLTLRSFTFSLLTIISLSCASTVGNSAVMSSQEHTAVVQEIYTLMKDNIVTKDQVDWLKLELTTAEIMGDSPTVEDRDLAISHLLQQTKTNHSFYRDMQAKNLIYESELKCKVAIATTNEPKDDIGYIRVDRFSGSNKQASKAFATAIEQQIIEQDASILRGWIVDLRHNSGGNMWPMLSGLSSLLGNGVHGYFIEPDGNSTQWGTYNGSSILGNRKMISLDGAYQLKNIRKPIAVLVSKRTASSGEAILIAFKGREDSRFFGQPSCGQSTANRRFTLKNGDLLFLTTATFADKNSNPYGGSILVDELTDSPVTSAVDWIYQQADASQ